MFTVSMVIFILANTNFIIYEIQLFTIDIYIDHFSFNTHYKFISPKVIRFASKESSVL